MSRFHTGSSMMNTAAQGFQYSTQAACLRSVCQRASIKLGFRCTADPSALLPQFCLHVSDLGENRIIFNFINDAPGTYEIRGIGYHDDGLLGAAVKFGNIAGRQTQLRNLDPRTTTRAGLPNRSSSHADAVLDGHAGPGAFASADGPRESVVNIFSLQNARGFLDIVYALTDGSLCITLHILELETHCHRRCINDVLPMIG